MIHTWCCLVPAEFRLLEHQSVFYLHLYSLTLSPLPPVYSLVASVCVVMQRCWSTPDSESTVETLQRSVSLASNAANTPGWWRLFSITTVTLRRVLWKDSNPGWEEATSCQWRLLKRCSLVFSISAAGRLSHCSLPGPRGVSLGWWTKAAPGLRRICSLSGEQLSRCSAVNLKAWKGLKHSDSFII